jgi:hypothetical protein
VACIYADVYFDTTARCAASKVAAGSGPLLDGGNEVTRTKRQGIHLHVGHAVSDAPSRCPRSPPRGKGLDRERWIKKNVVLDENQIWGCDWAGFSAPAPPNGVWGRAFRGASGDALRMCGPTETGLHGERWCNFLLLLSGLRLVCTWWLGFLRPR